MAGRSILDIVIKLSKQGGADRETIQGLAQLKSGIMEAGAVAGSLVAAGFAIKQAFDATVGTFVAYADQVRNVSQMTGMSAEESSALIQVTDDMKISFESLSKVIAKNGDLYDYSIQGLAGMATEYQSLGSETEKAAFMQERFGKNWGEFVELMQTDASDIIAAGQGINEALILDEAAIDSAREYQAQLDELSDSWEAVKISAGNAITPQTVSFLQDVNAEIAEENGQLFQAEKGWRMWLGPIGLVWNAIDLFTNKNDASISSMQAADAARWEGIASMYAMAEASTETADTMIEDYGRILKDAQTLSDAQRDYAEGYQRISQDMSLSDDERAQKLQELGAKYDATTMKVVSDNMLQKLSVDGLQQAEYERFLAFQVATGQMSSEAAAQAAALNEIAEAGANGTMSIQEMQAAIDALTDKVVNITIQSDVTGSGASFITNYGFNEILEYKGPGETMAGAGVPGGVAVGGGAAPVVVNLTINTAVSLGDRAQAEREIVPFVIAGIREAQARGVLSGGR